MAAGASTLQTLLIKLGFDTRDLQAGGKAARTELQQLQQAARQAAAMAAPAAAALENIARAGKAVEGSRGSTTTLNNLAGAAERVIVSTNGSANALNNMAKAAATIGATTGSGASLNAFARAVTEVAAVTNGSVAALTNFSKGAIQVLAASNGSAAALNRFMRATVEAARGAGSAAGAIDAVARAARGGAPSLQEVAAAADRAGKELNDTAASADRAAKSLGATERAARGAAGAANAVRGPAMRAAGAVTEVGMAAEMAARRASFMQRTLSMAFAFSGGVAVTTAMAFVGNAILGFNSRLEQAHIAFTTLLGDAEKANQFIQEMKVFAEVTPFEFAGLQDAVQRLMAMGFAADQVLPTLRVIGDTVAALGGSTEKLDRVATALGQMMTAGRVNAQDMRQLTEAGIPAWAILAEAIGKTTAETRKLAEDGLIPANVAVQALMEGLNTRYGGMMAQQARTAAGAWSTVHDALIQTISSAVEPLFAALSAGLVGLADFFIAGNGKYIVPAIHAIGIALAAVAIPHMIGAARVAMSAQAAFFGMTVPILPLIAALTILGIAWQENFGGIRTLLEPVVTGVLAVTGAVLDLVAGSGMLVPILVVLASVLMTRLVAGWLVNLGAMAMNAVMAVTLSGAFTGLTVTSGAAATSTGILRTAMLGLGGTFAIATGAIGLFIAAGVLLVTHFDQVVQGVRVAYFGVLQLAKAIVDVAGAMPGAMQPLYKAASEGFQMQIDQLLKDMAVAEEAINKKKAEAEAASTGGLHGLDVGVVDKAFFESFNTGAGMDELLKDTRSLVERFGYLIDGVRQAAKEAGAEAMEGMADEIDAHQNAPLEAFKKLHQMLRNQLEPSVEIARTYGMLISEDLAAGLASGNPAVFAQADATKKYLQDRLNELTGGAYQAGQDMATGLKAGLSEDLMGSGPVSVIAALNQAKASSAALATQWNSQFKPSAAAIEAAMAGVNEELRAMNSESLNQLRSAFREVQSAAERYFAKVHEGNLQAIDDALKHKNALLDAKAVLNQAPVTAAQKALDFQRAQIQEFRLREAIANATNPREYRDAVLALQDFLAQQHIDAMQAQVDAANDKIQQEKEANEALAQQQREAENARYERQKEDFERQLNLLREYLEKHPGEWSTTNDKVLALLRSYGIDYHNAGKLLGGNFVLGLQEQVAAAQAAAQALANVLPPWMKAPYQGPSGAPGAYYPNVNTGGGASLLSGFAETTSTAPTGMLSGFGTIVVQVGDQTLAEITDKQMAQQADIYGNPTGPTLSSVR